MPQSQRSPGRAPEDRQVTDGEKAKHKEIRALAQGEQQYRLRSTLKVPAATDTGASVCVAQRHRWPTG